MINTHKEEIISFIDTKSSTICDMLSNNNAAFKINAENLNIFATIYVMFQPWCHRQLAHLYP
ncbi:hypothetical protein SHLI107390_12350 [Shewanella livingstonensis]